MDEQRRANARRGKLDLQKLLDTFEGRRRYHHNALWEEEKHFAWLVSLILPALAAILLAGSLRTEEKLPLIMAGSLLGAVVAFFGLTVVRREGMSFVETMQVCNRISAALAKRPEGKAIFPDYAITDFREVASRANKPLWTLVATARRPTELGVRDTFQLLFLLALLSFCVAFIVAFSYLVAIYAVNWQVLGRLL